ncbi:hypothetical protein [Streptodolium elevatio]|uniref:Uncharacterized protein n=1 Tax=Streptodolium elevatio TaxID=3157996 RepID=A0ABV3DQT7_9ACTN
MHLEPVDIRIHRRRRAPRTGREHHDFFRTTMFAPRTRFPALSDGLMQAWPDDIADNKASARSGLLAVPTWPDEDDGKGTRTTQPGDDDTASTRPGQQVLRQAAVARRRR